MLKSLKIIGLLILIAPLSGFGEEAAAPAAEVSPEELKRDISYYFGYSFGNMLKDGGAEDVNVEDLVRGLNDSLGNVPPTLDPSRRDVIYQEIRRRQTETQEQRRLAQEKAEREVGAANLSAARSFLEENAKREGVMVTPSGLQYEIIADTEGPNATAASRVVVNYEGRLLSGEIFDKSSEPVEFGLNQVIMGWTEGLQLMSAGDRYRLYIPPGLAYGSGSVGQIPPNSLLVFDVELLEIK